MPAPELTSHRPRTASRWLSRGSAARWCCWHSASATAAKSVPITLATLAGARKKLGADAADVQVVYVTVDPERDDAAQMRKFLGSFDPTFVGGVGTRAQIDAAQKNYGISVDARPCTPTAAIRSAIPRPST